MSYSITKKAREIIRSFRGWVEQSVPYLGQRRYWGYNLVPSNILLVNFIFQRLLRLNASCPWSVSFSSCVILPANIHIGRNVGKSFAVSGGCYIQGINGIQIGDDTIFSFGVGIISANHNSGNLAESMVNRPVKIGKNCWLGKNAIILPGVELGDGCIVGAGAVVTKSYEAGTRLAGVPAKPIHNDE